MKVKGSEKKGMSNAMKNKVNTLTIVLHAITAMLHIAIVVIMVRKRLDARA